MYVENIYLYIGNEFNFVNLKYMPQGHCGFNSIKRIVWKVSEVTSLKKFLQFETILRTLNTEFSSASGGWPPLLRSPSTSKKNPPFQNPAYGPDTGNTVGLNNVIVWFPSLLTQHKVMTSFTNHPTKLHHIDDIITSYIWHKYITTTIHQYKQDEIYS